ncbi:MAG: DUF1648 domain-containing protein [Humibacillus sp.]|nr:DUF1648 domain-containing protein [Humibacillus sp.]MDN5775567.1 DUF1648 domain-containing protein [Humibacillus sp.]
MRSWLTKLFWVLAAAYFALVAWAAFALPERVPMHWSGTAGPAQWGSRTAAVIMLTGLGRPGASLPGWTLPVIVGWLVLLTGYLVWMVAVRWRCHATSECHSDEVTIVVPLRR